jgi:hypothetical protein
MFRQKVISKYKIVANKTTYYHGSPKDHGPLLKVKPLGTSIDGGENLFGGVFLSHYPIGHIGSSKNYWYAIDLADSEILDVNSIYSEFAEDDLKQILEHVFYMDEISDEDDLDYFIDIVSDRYSDEDKARDLFVKYDLVSSDEGHQWSWTNQAIQGQIAKKMGYKAVEMVDERGTVYLLVGPAELTKVKNEDLP